MASLATGACGDRYEGPAQLSARAGAAAQSAGVVTPEHRLAVGERAQLRGTIPQWSDFAIFANHIVIVATEQDLSSLRDAINAPATEGGPAIRHLLETTDAFGVPNGVDVTVRRHGDLGALVRIDEPGRVYSGKEGWALYAWVLPRPAPPPRDPLLPSYTVLEKMGSSIHVLVPSLQPNMSAERLAPVLIAITQLEAADEASFYQTRSAYDANVNGGPNQAEIDRRLKQGYLGSVEGGQFQPPLPF
jgi:hypothetical protein